MVPEMKSRMVSDRILERPLKMVWKYSQTLKTYMGKNDYLSFRQTTDK